MDSISSSGFADWVERFIGFEVKGVLVAGLGRGHAFKPNSDMSQSLFQSNCGAS